MYSMMLSSGIIRWYTRHSQQFQHSNAQRGAQVRTRHQRHLTEMERILSDILQLIFFDLLQYITMREPVPVWLDAEKLSAQRVLVLIKMNLFDSTGRCSVHLIRKMRMDAQSVIHTRNQQNGARYR